MGDDIKTPWVIPAHYFVPPELDEPEGDDDDGCCRWQFQLNDPVEIVVSGEQGTVQGRAEFVNHDPEYLIRYADGTGSAREVWWAVGALEHVEVQ